MPCTLRGGRMLFQREEIDAWASQRILGFTERNLNEYHQKSTRGTVAPL